LYSLTNLSNFQRSVLSPSVYFLLVCLLGAPLDPDEGSVIFLRNVCKVLSHYTASHPRRCTVRVMLMLVFLRCRILWRTVPLLGRDLETDEYSRYYAIGG
jgi:hypothetical protein